MAAEYGDSKHWTGDDNRDELAQFDPDCESCGAKWDQACDPGCDCLYCLRARARRAAAEFDALCPKDAA